jgi:hypothetical protein
MLPASRRCRHLNDGRMRASTELDARAPLCRHCDGALRLPATDGCDRQRVRRRNQRGLAGLIWGSGACGIDRRHRRASAWTAR